MIRDKTVTAIAMTYKMVQEGDAAREDRPDNRMERQVPQ